MHKLFAVFLAALSILGGPQAAAQDLVRMDPAQAISAGQALNLLRAQRSELLGGAKGVLIFARVPGSQAEAADIRPGDVVVAYAGKPVDDVASLIEQVGAQAASGKGIGLGYVRDGQRKNITVQAGKLGLMFHPVLETLAMSGNASAHAASGGNNKGQDDIALHVQTGHPYDVVINVAVSPDGTRAVSAGTGALKLWDLDSGKEIRSLASDSTGDHFVVISPDGRYAISGGGDAKLYVWDLHSGKIAYHIPGPPKARMFFFSGAAFSPDGKQFLASSVGGLGLWDFATGNLIRLMRTSPGDRHMPRTLAFSPDGRHAVADGAHMESGFFDKLVGDVRVWDVATGELLRSIAAHQSLVHSLAFSADGKILLSRNDKQVKLWDFARGAELRSIDSSPGSDGVSDAALAPDGRHVFVSGKALAMLDALTGKEVRRFQDAGDSRGVKCNTDAQSIGFDPNGRSLVTGGTGGICMWDIASGKVIRRIQGTGNTVDAISFSPDGSFLASGGLYSTDIWTLASGKPAASFDESSAQGISAMRHTGDGRHVLTGSHDKKLTLREVQSGKVVRVFEGHAGIITSASLSQDSRILLSSGGATSSMWKGVISSQFDQQLRLWDVQSGQLLRSWREDEDIVNGAVLSADGKRALSSTKSGIKVWDTTNASLVRAIPFGHVGVMAISHDGRRVLAASLDDLTLFDVDTGAALRTFAGSGFGVKSLAFSADDRLALSGGMDNKIRLWEVESGKELRSMSGHTGMVSAVAFSPDGRRAASGSADSTTRLWDVGTGKEILSMIKFKDGEWVSITPAGYFAASSPKAAAYLGVRRGDQVFGVDQLYDVFYRPDIVEAAIAGKEFSSMAGFTIAEAVRQPPPMVERIELPSPGSAATTRIAYRIKSTGGGIGEVRVFHNGKLIQSDGFIRQAPAASLGAKTTDLNAEALAGQMRALAQQAVNNGATGGITESRPKPDLYEATVEVEPVSGANEISVLAFNAPNTVHSAAHTVAFTSTLAPAPPRLHILAIGIDQYRDKSASLKFAAKDASDLANRWKAQAAAIYRPENIFVETISNEQASREGVLARINALAARIKPSDHFLLFIASHGVLLGDQYYMVTSDYNGKLQPSTMISANEIVDFSKRIKALSQLYILDTCHAGGVGGIVSGLYDARVSVLAKKMGLHLYASASSTEEALDGFEGNGLFTHTLLAGLNNNRQADTNTDKQVSMVELGHYSKAQTQALAKKMQHRQDPLIVNFGLDSPVYTLP